MQQMSISQAVEAARAPAHGRTGNNTLILRVVQPGLAGFIDGSVATLAPIFAAAVQTQSSHTAWVVGMAAAVGAGISMAFSEALSDSGALTGRGDPVRRGTITGACTFAGGVLHTLPFLISSYQMAIMLAFILVGCELIVIALVRHYFFRIPLLRSGVQVAFCGSLVFATGLLLGSA